MTEKELFETYQKEIYRTCYYMLRRSADAEDVCQEVFITVFRHDWQKVEFLKTWLIKIAMNHCLNHLKKENSFILKGRLLWQNATDRAEKPIEDIVEQKETEVEYVGLLHQLPVKIRAVMSLRYLNECNLNEIAAILNIPTGTVKSRLNKGLQMMRKIISANDYTGGESNERPGKGRTNVNSVTER
ncbi:RNA polymerase sigma factor [Paenibacillus agricola]|uniref:RNA polymerase sigma factor n=1 Tax=Paenibacillus agricola TaxID=2716264 RepID=A0ABX0JIW8_9BACL|nr:RNA polymerase sigma factor [Paenibacillus agricola]NHN34419.1 RNA polymerase sigma factor [Paenibacillus agricola]